MTAVMTAVMTSQIVFASALGLIALGISAFAVYVLWMTMWSSSPAWQARQARRGRRR